MRKLPTKRVSGFCLLLLAVPTQSYNQPFGMLLSLHTMTCTHMRCTPTRCTPRCTPTRCTPTRYMPVREARRERHSHKRCARRREAGEFLGMVMLFPGAFWILRSPKKDSYRFSLHGFPFRYHDQSPWAGTQNGLEPCRLRLISSTPKSS